MKLWFERVPTPLGQVLLMSDGEALRVLDFFDHEERMHRLLRQQNASFDVVEGPCPALFRQAIEAYFAGDLAAINDLPVATGGTPFQQEVWTALRSIPCGQTTTYGALAQKIGRPKAVRAVGLANGANPVGIVVPCHRVIGADGTLTGYGGGLPRKAWLLAHEGVKMPEAEPDLFDPRH